MSENEPLKKKLYDFMVLNSTMETNDFVKQFIGPLASKPSYRWIKKIEETETYKRKIAPGRPAKIDTKEMIQLWERHQPRCVLRDIEKQTDTVY